MKYALLNDKKIEATSGGKGVCPICESELVAKCGEVKVHHWAHKGKRDCDPWWENETEWHRSWKNKFPAEWQEVVQFNKDENGEKHIADVKTEEGWVLEFQHSYLQPEERRLRNEFYSKLIWVVDGLRRKTDLAQFERKLEKGRIISNDSLLQIRQIQFSEECRLLREWQKTDALVFFDFKAIEDPRQIPLWLLLHEVLDGEVYACTFPREHFIKLHNENQFDEVFRNIILKIKKELVLSIAIKAQRSQRSSGLSSPSSRRPFRRRHRRF